jgi:hypothetical protein
MHWMNKRTTPGARCEFCYSNWYETNETKSNTVIEDSAAQFVICTDGNHPRKNNFVPFLQIPGSLYPYLEKASLKIFKIWWDLSFFHLYPPPHKLAINIECSFILLVLQLLVSKNRPGFFIPQSKNFMTFLRLSTQLLVWNIKISKGFSVHSVLRICRYLSRQRYAKNAIENSRVIVPA